MAVAPFIDCLTSDGHQHFQPRASQYSTVQYSTVQCSSVQYRIKKTQGLYTKPVKGNRDMYVDIFLNQNDKKRHGGSSALRHVNSTAHVVTTYSRC